MMLSIIKSMAQILGEVPQIRPFLNDKALWVCTIPEIKSYDYYLRTITHMVHMVYDGYMGGDFIDVMASLIQGQLTRAYHEGIQDAGLEIEEMTPEMNKELEDFILSEYDYVDKLYKDIVDARIDGTPVENLVARAELWANRYNDVTNAARRTVVMIKGGKLEWVMNPDKEHCSTCVRLNGIVAFAKEWEESGFKPQSPPNPLLECGGWRCGCRLRETSKRRTPKALSRLLDIAVSQNL